MDKEHICEGNPLVVSTACALVCAMLQGVKTVLLDNPKLEDALRRASSVP